MKNLSLIIGVFLLFIACKEEPKKVKVVEPTEAIIKPGDDKAILTLSDGTKIILEDAKNGILANQAGVSIQKTSDGELLYYKDFNIGFSLNTYGGGGMYYRHGWHKTGSIKNYIESDVSYIRHPRLQISAFAV